MPAICDGEAEVYETGACLLYLAERFPAAGLEPPPGDPTRGAYLRWLVWLSDAFRPLWERIMAPQFFTSDERTEGVRAKGYEELAEIGASARGRAARPHLVPRRALHRRGHLPLHARRLAGTTGRACVIGGDAVQEHYARVGERPAIARARELDDLDERLLRHHPELRGGRPMDAPVVDLS